MSAFLHRDEIHAQLLRNAGRFWSWGENMPDEFTLDPAIRLLLGAVAGESERVGQEIESSRARVMERLAEVLTPDALTLPLPAHAMATASPPESSGEVTREDMFYMMHNGRESVFTPAGAFPLLGVQMRFFAVGSKIFRVEQGRKEVQAEAVSGKKVPDNTLWIGLSCAPGLDDLGGLRLFFDWKNQPDKTGLLPLFALAQWSSDGDTPLECSTGWGAVSTHSTSSLTSVLEDFFSPGCAVERDVCHFYAPQVITIRKQLTPYDKAPLVPRLYPRIFEDWFQAEDLRGLREPMVWLEVRFPQAFPAEILTRTEIGVNPFPVLNRRLNQTARTVPFHLPVVPLEIPEDEAFLGLESVLTSGGQIVPQGPFVASEHLDGLRVSVRTAGVARLDARAAPALLEHTLDVIRDEYQAFAAFDRDQLGAALGTLRQLLHSLEEKINPLRAAGDGVPCLAFRGLTTSENMRIRFWTTPGQSGNSLPAGSTLNPDPRRGLPLQSWLLTATVGGRARPNPTERLHLYRQAVLTRDRIVSREDIRAFAQGHLQKSLWSDITVQASYRVGAGAGQGLMRGIEVLITPTPSGSIAREAWRSMMHQLESALNERSTDLMPIYVKVQGLSL